MEELPEHRCVLVAEMCPDMADARGTSARAAAGAFCDNATGAAPETNLGRTPMLKILVVKCRFRRSPEMPPSVEKVRSLR
jgi:hypothetical protein